MLCVSGRDGNYNYDANIPAAALFAALFGLSLGLHLFQAIRGKCRYLLPLLIATLMESMVRGGETRIQILTLTIIWQTSKNSSVYFAKKSETENRRVKTRELYRVSSF